MSSGRNISVAKVLIIDDARNILLLRRSKTHPLYAYHWDFPGGEVEDDEDPKLAVLRELNEEAGIKIQASDLQTAIENNVSVNLKHYLYTATLHELMPKVTISWEHDKYVWLSVDEILKLTVPDNPDSYYIEVIAWLANAKLTS